MRESRQELRKYQREVKKNNPSAVCQLQYDKLFVNHRCYVWSDLQGRVVPHNPVRTTSYLLSFTSMYWNRSFKRRFSVIVKSSRTFV